MQVQKRTAVFGVAFLLVASLAAACGGGEEAPTPTATRAPAPTATTAPAATRAPTAVPTTAPATTAIRPTATPVPAATAAPTARTAAPTGKLRVAPSSFFNEQIRPSLGGFAGTLVYGAPIYDWLIWATPDGDLAPGVLLRWEMSADAMTWTLTVRQGLRFHNGDPLTAEDVKFTIERNVFSAANEAGASTDTRVWLQRFDSAQVLSPTSLRVNLKSPWSLMPIENSVRGAPAGAVLPKAYFERVGASGFDSNPIGSGPWKLTGHKTGYNFTYEATGVPHPYRQTPKFKELELLLVPEESTRVAMLKTGAADMAEYANLSNALGLRSTPGFQVLSVPVARGAIGRIYGIDDPRIKSMPTGNRLVRQAMDHAINYQEIVDILFGGLAEVSPRLIVTRGTLGYDPAWKPTEYSPAKAKELLAQAGYPSGFPLKVLQPRAGGPAFLPAVSEVLAGYWNAIGIKAELAPLDYSSLIQGQRKRPQPEEFIGAGSSIWNAITPTNFTILHAYYHSKGSSLLLSRPEADALYDKAVAELDTAKQVQYIRELVEMAYREHASYPVGIVPDVYGAGPRIASWKPTISAGVGMALETVTPK